MCLMFTSTLSHTLLHTQREDGFVSPEKLKLKLPRGALALTNWLWGTVDWVTLFKKHRNERNQPPTHSSILITPPFGLVTNKNSGETSIYLLLDVFLFKKYMGGKNEMNPGLIMIH